MTRVCFQVPQVEVDLDREEAGRLLHELDLLDRPYRRYSASGAKARLVEANQSDGRIDLDGWSFPEVWALCRALDHLRNLDRRDASDPPAPSVLWRLRDAALAFAGFAPIAYELALDVPDGRARTLWAWSGPYAPGDRCVSDDEAYTVMSVMPGVEHERLVCRPS